MTTKARPNAHVTPDQLEELEDALSDIDALPAGKARTKDRQDGRRFKRTKDTPLHVKRTDEALLNMDD